ncbi:MAG: hypothetical protein JW944_05460 [Deltaproteobacteria bacterium]|nr:hypothetical protein [Deltaproteobacteria bacterium]
MKIKYGFFFENGRSEIIELNLNSRDLSLKPFPVEHEEPWTRLDFHRCRDCLLNRKEHTHCPVARNLSYVLNRFKEDISYIKVITRVSMRGRAVEKQATIDEGVSSLMGLIMATSGCPVLDRFKPMAFTHVPFANESETIFRAVATYLTAQLFRFKDGKSADWELAGFREFYSTVNRVNLDFSERLRSFQVRDANINALILLDIFAQIGSISIVDDWMKKVKPLFSAFLQQDQQPAKKKAPGI